MCDNTQYRRTAEEDCCWICLGESSQESTLEQPCCCPRYVHRRCLARWQLQRAGTKEERICRFCNSELPDWKATLTPSNLRPAEPVMVVTLGNEVHRIKVKPGEDGMAEFQAEIRRLFQIPEDVEFEVTFRCRAPCTADPIQLEGMSSYEAATHCASLMAAQRLAAAAAGQHTAAPQPAMVGC